MEGFFVDIQRLILKQVAGVHAHRLRHLSRVNRMFRKWVSRYLVDTLNKTYFLTNIHLRVVTVSEPYDILDILQKQWTPTLLSSFIMYLSSSSNLNQKAAQKLFFHKGCILKDLKDRQKQLEIIATQKRNIERETDLVERYEAQLDNHKQRKESSLKKRAAAEEVLGEIKRKYKKFE